MPSIDCYIFHTADDKDTFVAWIDASLGYPNETGTSYPAWRKKWGVDIWGVARDATIDLTAQFWPGETLEEGVIDGTWNPPSPF